MKSKIDIKSKIAMNKCQHAAKHRSLFLLTFFVLSLLLTSLFPALQAHASSTTIHIQTVDDLLELSRQCRLDTWSSDKEVLLDNDLSLEGSSFTSIPSFGGEFDGQGHTISGFSITENVSSVGFFRTLQSSARVHDLTLSGSVSADGNVSAGGFVGDNYGTLTRCTFIGSVTSDYRTGGIAGCNESSGVIRACTAEGAVYGRSMTGGIAGCNNGLIVSSTNAAYINTQNSDTVLSLSDLHLDFTLDLSSLSSYQSYVETIGSTQDTGGIAGYHTGILLNCTNSSMVGYQHVGYNVGGVAGRSCGYVLHCVNKGSVYGRKDVGGIVGQMEPYIELQLTESAVFQLQEQLAELSDLVDKASADAAGSVGGVTSQINALSGSVHSAMNDVDQIASTVQSNVSDLIDSLPSGEDTPLIDTLPTTGEIPSAGNLPTVDGLPTTDDLPSADDLPSSDEISSAVEETASSVITEISNTVGSLEDGEDITDAISGFASQIADSTNLNGLTSTINGLSSQIAQISSAVAGTTGTLATDIQEITAKVDEVSATLNEALETAGQTVVSDTSSLNISEITLGKVSRSRNVGIVSGDINVGGITGSMAMEYALDPEDDHTQQISSEFQKQYELKAVIFYCDNTGTVEARRSNAGGICGKQDLGLIEHSNGFGNVSSESGDYVGGIVGLVGGSVRGCYAKCFLSGNEYVGGIAGSGIEETLSGSTGTVTGCCSMVDITGDRYLGAISGGPNGNFLNNTFVSDSLDGIDGISYGGKAEPISYTQMVNTLGVPDEMKILTLRFITEDETLYACTFHYGDSFAEDIFPEIPVKEGYSAVWDRTDLTKLHFDTNVSVVYTRFVASIPSSETRSSDKPVFYAEGNYDGTYQVETQLLAAASTDFAPLSMGLGTALSHYMSENPMYTWFSEPLHRSVLEEWCIQVPEDKADTHRIHYLSPEESSDNLQVYLREDDQWVKVGSESLGSYLVFEIPGTTAEIAIVKTIPIWGLWAAALLLLIIVLTLIILLIVRISRRRKARKAASRSSEEEEGTSSKRSHKGLWIGLSTAFACLLLLALAAGWLIRGRLAPWSALQKLVLSPEMSAQLNAEYTSEDTTLSTASELSRKTIDGWDVTRLYMEDLTLYYADGMILLENGSAFRIAGSFEDYSDLLPTLLPLVRSARPEILTEGDSRVYTYTINGEDASDLLQTLFPELSDSLISSLNLNLTIRMTSGEIDSLTLSTMASSGLSTSEESTSFSLFVTLTDFTTQAAFLLPDPVLQALSENTATDLRPISGNLFTLLQVWNHWRSQDAASADLLLNADCGLLKVNTSLGWSSQKIDGLTIQTISKNNLTLYFNESKTVNRQGKTILASENSLVSSVQIPDMISPLLTQGNFSADTDGDITTYHVDLNETAMQQLVSLVAPEADTLTLTYEQGVLDLVVAKDTILSASISITGSVSLVVTDVPFTVSCQLVMTDSEPSSIPQEALDALR